jgi:hypothetical protein
MSVSFVSEDLSGREARRSAGGARLDPGISVVVASSPECPATTRPADAQGRLRSRRPDRRIARAGAARRVMVVSDCSIANVIEMGPGLAIGAASAPENE